MALNERLAAKESPGDWDDNTYWHTDGPDRLRFYRREFSEWQSAGLDQNSQIADPRFIDAREGDFRLKSDSPAVKRGFQPLDISRVGLYGDAAWVAEVNHTQCRTIQLPAQPEPPKPLEVDDDFESTDVGSQPAQATVSGEERGASIIISDALGTSMPTSITVVLTSTSYSPAAKADITSSFSFPLMRPCNNETRRSLNTSPLSRSYSSTAAPASRFSLSSTSGQTT